MGAAEGHPDSPSVISQRPDLTKFGLAKAAPRVFLSEPAIREFGLRILVEVLHVGVGRRAVEIEVALFHILSVISLLAGDAEKALLENRVAAIPERDREADQLVPVGNAGDAVFVPAISLRAGVLMRERSPGVLIAAVVFANRSPGALAEVRTPTFPVTNTAVRFLDAMFFRSQGTPHAAAAGREATILHLNAVASSNSCLGCSSAEPVGWVRES